MLIMEVMQVFFQDRVKPLILIQPSASKQGNGP
jgi:hypothetical protein